MVTKAVELAKTHGWFLTRQFENEANPDIHSRTTAREIIDDFKGEKLDYWVTGYGTGGTLKGVARVLAKEMPDTKIIVCEPEDAQLLASGIEQARNPDGSPAAAASGLQAASHAGLDAGLHPEAHRGCRGHEGDRPLIPIPGAEAIRCSKELATQGRHLRRHHRGRHLRRRACRLRAEAPKGANILCMLPDTGERYLSTPLFANVPADMTPEEVEISRSTPGAQFALERPVRTCFAHGLSQLHVKGTVASVAGAGTGVTEHDGPQVGLLQPLGYAAAQDATLRFPEGAGEMIALRRMRRPCR